MYIPARARHSYNWPVPLSAHLIGARSVIWGPPACACLRSRVFGEGKAPLRVLTFGISLAIVKTGPRGPAAAATGQIKSIKERPRATRYERARWTANTFSLSLSFSLRMLMLPLSVLLAALHERTKFHRDMFMCHVCATVSRKFTLPMQRKLLLLMLIAGDGRFFQTMLHKSWICKWSNLN